MAEEFFSASSRRNFLVASGGMTAGALLATNSLSAAIYAGEENTLRVALVGCGGRGTGAALNALSTDNGPIKLVAMADVFDQRLESSLASLKGKEEIAEKIDVPEDQRYIGFDGYKQAMDCLRPGDIVILATPPGFRWVQYTYAIEKGLNVFMEKPVTIDAPTSARMLEINKKAKEKNLKVAVGLMCRHCDARKELLKRIEDGEIGEITMLRAYRMAGPTASAFTRPQKGDKYTELMYQIRNFHSFLWLSGGAVSDFLIHNIDEACWMKGKWPVSVIGLGGRHYRGDYIDQNFDTYAMEYTFDDGTKLFVDGRTMPGCKNEFASFAHGTKGVGVISTAGHWPAHCAIHKGHKMTDETVTWAFPQPEPNPYQLEWNDFIAAIRDDAVYNEVDRGVMASAVTSMGRMSCHTGQEMTLEQFLKHDHEFAPQIAELTLDSPSPLQVNEYGKYPVPAPGIVTDREYA